MKGAVKREASPDASAIINHSQGCEVCGRELASALANIKRRMGLPEPCWRNP